MGTGESQLRDKQRDVFRNFFHTTSLRQATAMSDGVMLVRQIIKAEIEKTFANIPLTEATLAELVRLYWKELSEQDRQRIQNKAQRNWYCHLSSTSQDLKNNNVQQIRAHRIHQDTLDSTLSTDIPVLGDFGYQSRPLAKPSKRYEFGKKIVAAQLSKQFTPLPLSDPHLNLHIPPAEAVAINEKYSERALRLRKYSELNSESEMRAGLKQYRRMNE
jgi:hypothetical protein